jgi:ATP-dependent DNA helicase RecQ
VPAFVVAHDATLRAIADARPTSPRSLPGSSSRSQGALPDTPHIAALRAWRTLRARSDDVPAFVIAHDATLRAIADARPTTLAALGRVKGMGPTKLDRYGPEILAALEGVTAND